MINKLKELRAGGEEEGFTLIELMIVVVIIGILAAIAIPIFANQQKSAISAGLKSDVKNANTAIATALVKKPTATGLDSAQSAAGADVVITIAAATTSPVAAAITTTVKVSDSGTTLDVSGNWNTYVIVGTNAAADPGSVTYTASTGKIT